MSNLQVGRPTAEPDLWKPVLLRALIAVIFGLLTVFWPDITPLLRAVAAGIYLLVSGVAVLYLLRAVRRGLPEAAPWLGAESLVFGLGGVLVFILQDAKAFVWVAGASLFLVGLIELFLGFRYRLQTVLGRDWLISGAVAVVAAVLLVSLANTSLRAPIGVLGGSAVIIGVMALLAALSYRQHGAEASGGENSSLRGVE